MIATFITSPLGLVIVLALMVLALWIVGLRDRRELERLRRVRARELRRSPGPQTLAGHVFHQAGLPGRPDCSECKGEGGSLELLELPFGRLVELEATCGLELPPGLVIPHFVLCQSCVLARAAQAQSVIALFEGAPPAAALENVEP